MCVRPIERRTTVLRFGANFYERCEKSERGSRTFAAESWKLDDLVQKVNISLAELCTVRYSSTVKSICTQFSILDINFPLSSPEYFTVLSVSTGKSCSKISCFCS